MEKNDRKSLVETVKMDASVCVQLVSFMCVCAPKSKSSPTEIDHQQRSAALVVHNNFVWTSFGC